MYKDTRPADPRAETASTPEVWAAWFAHPTPMNAWRRFRFSRTKEWALIRRYIPRGASILDAGCGFGEWVGFLAAKGYRPEGLDYSDALIARARSFFPHLPWHVGDIRRLPQADGSMGAVISWGVVEHDEAGPGAALREFWRVLQPGGVAIVTVPLDSVAQRRSADYLHHRGGHQVFFQYFMTEEELASHVRDAGFEILDQGILPNAIIELVSPRLAARLRGVARRGANVLLPMFFSWLRRYSVMRYCVAMKPLPATQGS